MHLNELLLRSNRASRTLTMPHSVHFVVRTSLLGELGQSNAADHAEEEWLKFTS